MIAKTLGEICDELSIMYLKQKYLDLDSRQLDRIHELEMEYYEACETLPHSKSLQLKTWFEKLQAANAEIWKLESSMRNLRVNEWFSGKKLYEEMGKRAESIREINAWRVKYKNEINELNNEVTEVKGEHLSGN